MDLTAFRVTLEAARSFEAKADGATFRLRVPTDHAWRVALETHRDAHGGLLESVAMREVLNAALTGWEGVTQRHLLAEGSEEALPFNAEARSMLLDMRQDIADELSVQLASRISSRRKDREAARKN